MGLDYYTILNIPRDATLPEIRLAYRKLALATHPEREKYPQHPQNPPEGICEDPHLPALPPSAVWEYINEAYDVLSNNLHREVYDRFGEEGLKKGVPAPNGYIQPYCYHKDYRKTYMDVFGTFSPYADLIDAVTHPPPLYCVAEGKGVRIKCKDVEKVLYLDLKEIFYGAIRKMKILRHEFIDDQKMVTKIREKILVIPIPPGIPTGTKITFPEEGDQGPTKIPADIVFIVAERPHDIFMRQGADLYADYKINLKEALCGFVITITTLDDRTLKIPITDVVTPTYSKKIDGEGLPYQDDNTRKGDLYIHFDIEFPTYLTRACKDKFAEAFAQIDCGFPLSHDKVNKMVLAQKMNRLERENEMAQRQC